MDRGWKSLHSTSKQKYSISTTMLLEDLVSTTVTLFNLLDWQFRP